MCHDNYSGCVLTIIRNVSSLTITFFGHDRALTVHGEFWLSHANFFPDRASALSRVLIACSSQKLALPRPGFAWSWIGLVLDRLVPVLVRPGPVSAYCWIRLALDRPGLGSAWSSIDLDLDRPGPGSSCSWIGLVLERPGPGSAWSWVGWILDPWIGLVTDPPGPASV